MKIVNKGWGFELWIVNKPQYCGKLLHFEAGKRCSYHYHKEKDETFYLHSGKMVITYGYDDDTSHSESITLYSGQRFYVPTGMRHQMFAVEDSELFEFSTEHKDEDSYRVAPGDSQKENK
jgi:mannose-6-phosphate isomerase-like protein (cupin superfamily)